MSDILAPLWSHQKKGIDFAEGKPSVGFFYEPGCGKTRTAINVLYNKFRDEGSVLRTLILCPPIVINNWKREIAKYSEIPEEIVTELIGPGKKRAKTFYEKGLTYDRANGVYIQMPHVFITNYESLLMNELMEHIKVWNPQVMILDELHRVKANSKRTKALIPLADTTKYKIGLTGTPILNSAMDIFWQFRVLDGGATFGKNFFVFKNMYFEDKNRNMPRHCYFPNWTIRKSALDAINEKIATIAQSALKAECLDLPPLVKKNVYLDMTPEQEKHYESMKENFITFYKEKAVVAELAITKMIRLQQIVSGFMKSDDGSEMMLDKNPKQDALFDLLEELAPNHKVIVWAVFKQDYVTIKKVCDKLKIKYVEVHGEIGSSDRFAFVDEFNNDPKCRVFIGHPKSAGEGINLISSSYSIYFSRDFSLGSYLQSEARNYRGGSDIHKSVTHINLVMKNTVDEVIMSALERKGNVADEVLRSLSV